MVSSPTSTAATTTQPQRSFENIGAHLVTGSPLHKKIRKYVKKLDNIERTKKKDPATLNNEQKALLTTESEVLEILEELRLMADATKVGSDCGATTATPRGDKEDPNLKTLKDLVYVLSFGLNDGFQQHLQTRGVTKTQLQALVNLEHNNAALDCESLIARTKDIPDLTEMVKQLEKNEITDGEKRGAHSGSANSTATPEKAKGKGRKGGNQSWFPTDPTKSASGRGASKEQTSSSQSWVPTDSTKAANGGRGASKEQPSSSDKAEKGKAGKGKGKGWDKPGKR